MEAQTRCIRKKDLKIYAQMVGIHWNNKTQFGTEMIRFAIKNMIEILHSPHIGDCEDNSCPIGIADSCIMIFRACRKTCTDFTIFDCWNALPLEHRGEDDTLCHDAKRIRRDPYINKPGTNKRIFGWESSDPFYKACKSTKKAITKQANELEIQFNQSRGYILKPRRYIP